MARINYFGILEATKAVIEADADVRALHATVEITRPTITMNMSPHVNIHEGRRDNATQVIAGGTRQRYLFRWSVVVGVFSAAGFEDATRQRDELIGVVEIALMKNRDLNGALVGKQLLLQGGALQSEPTDAGFWSLGTIDLAAEVVASTS